MTRMDLKLLGLTVCLVVLMCVRLSVGSAWLQDPPSRSSLWMYGIKARPNYDFRNLNCGNQPVQIQADGSRNCGICGDAISDLEPRPNENGGKYANPIIKTRYFESGSVAEISIRNNLAGVNGWFYEFRLCTDGDNPTQECLNRNLLTIIESNSTNVAVPMQPGTNVFHVQLPAGVICTHCLFQWRFRKGKSVAGCDYSNWCGLGRGPQIEFYNCADVIIGAVGQSKPTDQSELWEPTYDTVDYGSAYDVATTLTTSGGGTTHQHTTASPTASTTSRFNVITIPTAFPPTGTTQSSGGTAESERLISGLLNGGGPQVVPINGANSRTNNAPLLLLLGLLPLLGAASLRDYKPFPVPPIAPSGFWVQTPPLTEYYLGANIGFGNFGSNGIRSGDNRGSGYTSFQGNQHIIGNPGLGTVPRLADADFVNTNVQLREMVQNNANIIKSGSNQYNSGTFSPSNNVVWNNNNNNNNGLSNHAYSSTNGFHPQTNHGPYQPTPEVYGPQRFPNTGHQPQPIRPMQQNNVWNGNDGGIQNTNSMNINNNINGISGTSQRFPTQGTLPRQALPVSSDSQTSVQRRNVDLPGIAPASRLLQSQRTVTLTSDSENRSGFAQRNNGLIGPVSSLPNERQRMVHDWYNQLMGYVPSTSFLSR